MHLQFYLRMGLVYVPTTAIVQRGVYQIVEPVVVVALSDKDAVERALSDALARGNPKIPAPDPSDRSPPVLAKYAGVKKWSTFVRDASLWAIDERDGHFEILGYRKDPPNGWVRDKGHDEIFPTGTAAPLVIKHVIAILQKAARAKNR